MMGKVEEVDMYGSVRLSGLNGATPRCCVDDGIWPPRSLRWSILDLLVASL